MTQIEKLWGTAAMQNKTHSKLLFNLRDLHGFYKILVTDPLFQLLNEFAFPHIWVFNHQRHLPPTF